MIKLNEVHKVYSQGKIGFHALKDINLYFEKGEIITVFGPSGCGKTTLLNIIGGLDLPTSGDMVIDSKLTTTFLEKEWDYFRNHRIGFIFQAYNLIEHLPIVENVALSSKIAGVSNKEAKEKAIVLLKKVGLEDHLTKLPGELSGGERQRVSIARALINDPEIILADEPTGALDKKTGYEVMDLIKSICADKLVVIVTHNKHIADRYSTRKIELKDGRVVADTKPNDKVVEIIRGRKTNKKKLSFKESLRFSMYNIKGKIWRTLLVSLGLSVGIVGLILIDSFFNSVRDGIESESAVLVNNPDLLIHQEFEENPDIAGDIDTIDDYGFFKEVLYAPNAYILFGNNVTDDYSVESSGIYKAIQVPKSSSITDTFTNLIGDSVFPSGDGEVMLSVNQAEQLLESSETLTDLEVWEAIKNDEFQIFTRYNYTPEYYTLLTGIDNGSCIVTTSKWDGTFTAPDGYNEAVLGTIQSNISKLRAYRTNQLEYSSTQEIYCADYDQLDWSLDKNDPIFEPTNVTVVGLHKNDLFPEVIMSDDLIVDIEVQSETMVDGEAGLNVFENSVKFRGFLKNDEVDNKISIFTKMERDGYFVQDNPRAGLSALGPIVNFFMYVVQFIFSSIVSIAILTGGLMLLLILFIGILERKREIGLIRAMGGTRGDVRKIYSSETTIIGIIAGIISVITAIILVYIANIVIYNNYLEEVVKYLPFVDPKHVLTINFGTLIWAVIGSIAIAYISGLAPSIKAGRKKPIEALRNE